MALTNPIAPRFLILKFSQKSVKSLCKSMTVNVDTAFSAFFVTSQRL